MLDGGAGTDSLNVTVSAGAARVLKNMENVNGRFTAAVALDLDSATGVTAVTVANSLAAGTVGGLVVVANLSVKDQELARFVVTVSNGALPSCVDVGGFLLPVALLRG